MTTRRKRSTLNLQSAIEALEGRVVLSTMASAGTVMQVPVAVAKHAGKPAATTTTLAVSTGTLGQPVTIEVTVKAAASAGAPTGTVNIIDSGQVVDSIPLTAATSTGGKASLSVATSTLIPQAGGGAYFFGKHQLSAVFVPAGSFAKSTAVKAFTVAQPSFSTLTDGVKVATITTGSGAQIQSGQAASVLYTGYLAKTGKIFDDSINDGGTPLKFTVGAGEVVPGFDAGVSGMQPGETRIVEIPASQAYGSKANGPIPGNSTLIFVITLESIS